MKRNASILLVLGLLAPFVPPFIPPSWFNIIAVDWQPAPWPGLDAEIVQEPAAINPVTVDGLIGQRILNSDAQFQARFMTIPGKENLNSALYKYIREEISKQESVLNVSYYPEVHPVSEGLADRNCAWGATEDPAERIFSDKKLGPRGGTGVAIVCDIVVASGSVIGQRLRTISSVDEGAFSDKKAIFYQNYDSGQSIKADELWEQGAANFVWDSFIAVLKREAGAVGLNWTASAPDEKVMQEALQNTVIEKDGSFVVTFPAGVKSNDLISVGIEKTAEKIHVRMPEKLVTHVLSDVGLQMLTAVKIDDKFVTPAYYAAGNEALDCSLFPCVALTYDDGPSIYTDSLLNSLANAHASATFFVLGQQAQYHPEVLQRAKHEGHMIENHSWSHSDLTRLKKKEIASEINRTNTAIYDVIEEVPSLLRPPYGAVNDEVFKIAKMPAILWDVDTNDWQKPKNKVLIRHAVDYAAPGSIVLMHDIHENTVKAAPQILQGLRDRGFQIVNLRQLFNGELPQEGKIFAGY